jgi:hypothetical protein
MGQPFDSLAVVREPFGRDGQCGSSDFGASGAYQRLAVASQGLAPPRPGSWPAACKGPDGARRMAALTFVTRAAADAPMVRRCCLRRWTHPRAPS